MKSIFYTILILLFTSLSFQSFGQGCDGFRYLNDIATAVNKETVQFGENINGAGVSQDLFMDIYTPDGDTETQRPVIFYAFGGSFIQGSRDDGFVVDFCENYAKRGYVTVGIDYRLYNFAVQGFPDSLDMIEEVIMAVADMKAAVRYMRSTISNGNPYGIDTDKFYVGGISAGAITAAHTAYINEESDVPDYVLTLLNNNGGVNGNTDLPSNSLLGESSEVHAVVNMSGALHRANFMEAGDPPIVSVHGDNDDTVPYAYGSAAVFGFDIASVEGSSLLHAQAQAVGVTSELYTVEGGGHVDFYNQEPHVSIYDEMIRSFLHDEVTCNIVSNENLEDVSASVKVYPNPVTDKAIIASDATLGMYDLDIIDQLGRVIETVSNIENNTYELDRKNLVSGIYYIQLRFHNEDFAPANKRLVLR